MIWLATAILSILSLALSTFVFTDIFSAINYAKATQKWATCASGDKVIYSFDLFKTAYKMSPNSFYAKEQHYNGEWVVKEPYISCNDKLVVFSTLKEYFLFVEFCKKNVIGDKEIKKEEPQMDIEDESVKYSNSVYKEQYVLCYQIGNTELLLSVYADDVVAYVDAGCNVFYISKEGNRIWITKENTYSVMYAIKFLSTTTDGVIDGTKLTPAKIPNIHEQKSGHSQCECTQYTFFWLNDSPQVKVVSNEQKALDFASNIEGGKKYLRCKRLTKTCLNGKAQYVEDWVDPYSLKELTLPRGAGICSMETLWQFFYESKYIIAWTCEPIVDIRGYKDCNGFVEFLNALSDLALNSTARIVNVVISDKEHSKSHQLKSYVWTHLMYYVVPKRGFNHYYLSWGKTENGCFNTHSAKFIEKKNFEDALNRIIHDDGRILQAHRVIGHEKIPMKIKIENTSTYACTAYGQKLSQFRTYNVTTEELNQYAENGAMEFGAELW